MPVAYAAHPAHQQKPTQNPQTPALNRKNALNYKDLHCELTSQQKIDVAYVQQFKPVCNDLPAKLQGSVSRIDKLNPGEQALFASDIASRLQKDETAQDLKRVLHILVEDSKESKTLPIVKPTTIENKSLFFGEPKTHLSTIESSWKPFELSSETKAVGDQLEQKLSNWEQSPKFPAIGYKK